VTEKRDRAGDTTKKKLQTDRRGHKQVRTKITSMRHKANVRTNASESDRVKRKREKDKARDI